MEGQGRVDPMGIIVQIASKRRRGRARLRASAGAGKSRMQEEAGLDRDMQPAPGKGKDRPEVLLACWKRVLRRSEHGVLQEPDRGPSTASRHEAAFEDEDGVHRAVLRTPKTICGAVETCFGHQAQAFSSNSPQSVYLFHDSLQLILQRMIGRNFPAMN
jgi:hypothetical protein